MLCRVFLEKNGLSVLFSIVVLAVITNTPVAAVVLYVAAAGA